VVSYTGYGKDHGDEDEDEDDEDAPAVVGTIGDMAMVVCLRVDRGGALDSTLKCCIWETASRSSSISPCSLSWSTEDS
jgi:hypothetical protein